MKIVSKIDEMERRWLKFTNTQLPYIPADGWIQTDEWTRTGDYTFTVPGNLTNVQSILGIGTKVRYRLPGTVSDEYGYIKSVGGSPITVTLVANSNYAMTATPDRVWYSNIEKPTGHPIWLDFNAVVITGTGGMTIASTSLTYSRFRISGLVAQFIINATVETAGVASNAIQTTMPIGSATANVAGAANVRDAAAGLTSVGQFTVSTVSSTFRKFDASNWGIGTGRILIGSGVYPLA